MAVWRCGASVLLVATIAFVLIFPESANAANAAPVSDVKATAGPNVLHTLQKSFLGVTLDWWQPTGGCSNCGGGWRNASVTKLDLQSARLRVLGSALSPAILRLGGSLDKDIQYWLPEHVGENGVFVMPPPPPNCAPNSTSPHLCLNATRWAEVNEFCTHTGLQLVFGLSLNITQNEALIRYSKEQGYSILAYEIPEEYTPGWTNYPGSTGNYTEYIGWYHQLSALLKGLWSAKPTERPLLVGPCEGMVGWSGNDEKFYNFTTQWVRKVVADTAGVLDVLVYHSYNNDALTSQQDATFFLNQTLKHALAYIAEAERVDPPLPVWLGEGAFHNGGCSVGGCQSFGSSMYYIDALSTLAKLGHFGFNRQTLVGGNYELLDTATLEPNPDFYVAMLFTSLMGDRVLEVNTVPLDPDLHLFAHCGVEQGAVTFSFANRSPTRTFSVDLAIATQSLMMSPSSSSSSSSSPMPSDGDVVDLTRDEYHFRGTSTSNEFSPTATLNGRPLLMKSYSTLPSLDPQTNANSKPLILEPFSVGYAVVRNVHANFCN
eukprot:m.61181 g.61181  ORF g.61181 m.61181 type:complete len:545 (+) comp22944_c0_seq1:16-1650(+)